MRSVLTFAGRTIAWIVILGASGLIIAAVLVPRIAGATPYTVLTGSMSPAYPPGTLVVVKPVDVDELRVGDVVTVQLESGKETVVTHRISAIAYQLDGDVEIQTKGDANPSPDADLRMPVQIRGKLWYSIPYVGYVATAVTASDKQWIVGVIAVGLVGYAVWMFAGAWRERGKTKAEVDESESEGDARRTVEELERHEAFRE